MEKCKSSPVHAGKATGLVRASLISAAIAAAFGMQAVCAAEDNAALQTPVQAGSWQAARNEQTSGNYDINVFQQLLTGTGEQTISVSQAFGQAEFEAVKALDGFGEFGSYYEDGLHNPYEVGMVDGVLINGPDTNITVENAAVQVTAEKLDEPQYVEVGGIYHREGSAAYGGETMTVDVTSAADVDSEEESWVYGYAVENPLGWAETQRQATFNADKTSISAESTSTNGTLAIAFLVSTDALDEPQVTFARGETSLSAKTAAESKSAIALYLHNSDGNIGKNAAVTLNEGASLKLAASGGEARGLHADHGTFTSNGTLDITAKSNGDNDAYGIFAGGDAVLQFNGATTVYAQGEGNAHALYVGLDPAEITSEETPASSVPSVTFDTGSTTALNGAVFIEKNHAVTMNGTVNVTGDFDLEGTITGKGDLTINGQKAEFGDVMEGGFVSEDASISVGSLTLANVDFTNEGDIYADTITLNNGAVVTNLGGFHNSSLILNTGSRFIETYDLAETEDAEEFKGGILTIGADLIDFSGGELAIADKNGQAMDLAGIKIQDDGADDARAMIRFSASKYSLDSIEVASTKIEEGARLQVTGGSLTLGTLTVSQGDVYVSGGTLQADALDLANGLLTVAEGAALSTYSGQIFTTGLNEEGSNADADSLKYTTDHLLFNEGSTLTLRDAFYNDDYAASAGALLDGVHVTFTGTAVDAEGEAVTEKPLEDMADGTTQSTVTITATGENGTVSVDKSVGGKNIVVDEGTTTVAIAKENTLTLVGSAEGGELVGFQSKDEASVDVAGGLALGSAAGESTKGTISAGVTLSEGATLSAANGEFTLAEVAATDAAIEAASGTLTVTDLTLSGTSSVTSAAGASTTIKTVTAEAGTHQLKGDITAGTVAGAGTILVGSAAEDESAAATLNVDTLAHSGVIFIDPAWTDGAQMQDGSFLTVQQLGEDGTLNAKVVAGQNSTFVFGASKDDAVDAFAKTGLTYGEKDVTAVLYVAKPIEVDAAGAILVDGSLASLGTINPDAGSVTVAKNGLAMFDAKALENGPALTADSVTFDEGSHIRVVNLTKTSEGTLIDAGTLTIADSVIEDAKSTSAIVSLDLTKNDDGTLSYTTTLNDAEAVFTGFEGASLMNAMHEAGRNDVDAADAATRFLSRMAAYGDYGVSSAAEASAIGNQAMALAATAGVYNVALDASKLMNRSVNDRMSIANGLVRSEGATVWADVLATRTSADSLYGDSGYSVDLYGYV